MNVLKNCLQSLMYQGFDIGSTEQPRFITFVIRQGLHVLGTLVVSLTMKQVA